MVAAQETTLQELLEGTKQYQVPLYQRTYSWTKPQLERLWEDVRKLTEDRVHDPSTTHFIGSLVLAPSPANGPTGIQGFLVVDGQQRLTTLSILLCAIRDHRSQHEGEEHRARINDQYLINKYKPAYRLKLLPTQADRAAYLACLDSTPQAGGSDPVSVAYGFFAKRLHDADDPDDPFDIENIENAVLSGLALVSVTAQAGDNVHRIFESLNNTGLKLTQADLLRNYLFMRLPARGEAVYESLWLPLQKQLTSDELELLFWLDLVQRDTRIKQTDVYSGQQARLNRLRDEDDIEQEVKRLSRLGALLRTILNPAEEPDPEVRFRLERLRAWGTTTVYPLLLRLLDRRAQGSATSEQIATAMLYVESFFVRRLLVGRATANLNRILLTAVTEMNADLPVDEAIRAYLSTGRKHYATDANVREAVASIPYYLNGRAQHRNLVLQWLEASYGSKEPVALDSLTIEHVMPQTPTTEWRQMLSGDLEPEEHFDEAHETLVHTLGNLTLTGYNAELSNSSFAVKRVQLAKSGLRLNQEIAEKERWGRTEIRGRAATLAERIIDLWPGPTGAAVSQQMEAHWDIMNKVLAELPAGSWTTYGDIAALIGSHPVAVGTRLATQPAPNAYRVLQVEGIIAPNFRWIDPNRRDDPRELLSAEGVEFDRYGRANPAQRIVTEELAQLLGGMPEDLPGQSSRSRLTRQIADDRFVEQLTAMQGKEVARATVAVLDAWAELGGILGYGSGGETSCFLLARDKEHELGNIWPAAIYPRGKFEVVFQHLSIRTPFDDVALREELRQRLNQLPGVEIAAAKLTLRPGFPLKLLADPEVREGLLKHLDWFYQQAQMLDS